MRLNILVGNPLSEVSTGKVAIPHDKLDNNILLQLSERGVKALIAEAIDAMMKIFLEKEVVTSKIMALLHDKEPKLKIEKVLDESAIKFSVRLLFLEGMCRADLTYELKEGE